MMMVMIMTNMIRTYSELLTLKTFEERFEYLNLNGVVCEETFGSHRYLNQRFYTSPEWRRFRRDIIIRDNGCDLGLDDHPIEYERIIIHHLNPLTIEDVLANPKVLMDPENVICVKQRTHLAIHYGDEKQLDKEPIERSRNDTCPWKS